MLSSSLRTSTECKDQIYCEDLRLLDEQLDWLTVDHDDLREDLLEQISRPKYHPSMAVINQWEAETIAHIRRTAVLARRALIDALDQHVIVVQKTLNTLTSKLHDARYRIQPFNQNDIQAWATVLQELKQTPEFLVTVGENNHISGLIIDLKNEKRTDHTGSNRCPINPINLPKKTAMKNKKVRFADIPSSRSHSITPGGVIIIPEPPKNKPTIITPTRIRRAHAEIPFDSRSTYPLRGPATVYR